MYSENQSRQLYVLSDTQDDVKQPVVTDSSHSASVTAATTAAGSIQFVKQGSSDEAYFLYKGPSDDGLQRSDLLKKCNVVSVTLSDASDLVHKNKKAVITFSPSVLSSTNVSVSGDYILNVYIHNFVALDYNTTLFKFGATHAAAGTAASTVYKNLATSLDKSFSREPGKYIKVGVSAATTGANPVWVGGDWSQVTAAAIVIEEVEQPFRLGVTGQEFVNFEVAPSTVYDATNNTDIVWGRVQFYGSAKYTNGETSASTISAGGIQTNAKKVADMEYFYHKNRGDVYGYSEWPNDIDTKYLASATHTNGYSMVDIHYYYEGNSHNIGHSEKTITLVGTKALLKRLIGSARVTGTNAAEPTGLYAFLEGTNAIITKSSSTWDS